jgi:hypothetical protein
MNHEKAIAAAAKALCRDGGTGLCVGFCHSPGRCAQAVKNHGDTAERAVAAYLAQREADGWVLAPARATEAMIEEAYESYNANGGSLHKVYIDMIAARFGRDADT